MKTLIFVFIVSLFSFNGFAGDGESNTEVLPKDLHNTLSKMCDENKFGTCYPLFNSDIIKKCNKGNPVACETFENFRKCHKKEKSLINAGACSDVGTGFKSASKWTKDQRFLKQAEVYYKKACDGDIGSSCTELGKLLKLRGDIRGARRNLHKGCSLELKSTEKDIDKDPKEYFAHSSCLSIGKVLYPNAFKEHCLGNNEFDVFQEHETPASQQ